MATHTQLPADLPLTAADSTSIFYLVGLFDLWRGLASLLASAAGTYCIAKYLQKSPYMPWIGFVFLMCHMSLGHIRRQVANSPSMVDITGTQMVLVMKLSAFCWNVADGQLHEEFLSDFQKDRALRILPRPLDFTAYVLFFPGLLAGPAFDYAEYRRWIDTSMFDMPSEVDPAKRPPVRKKRKIPRSGTPATLKALHGLLWIGLYVSLSSTFSPGQLVTKSYLHHGLARRICIMYMVNLVARLKYYGVWTLAEGSCILAGLGYNGVDPVTGRVSWNRLQNIDPWMVETAQNPRGYLAGWNMNTNTWLRNYVYLRVTPRGKKPGFRASMATFVTSALWHGFYPGYYLTFVLASLIQTAAKSKFHPAMSCRGIQSHNCPQMPLPAASLAGQLDSKIYTPDFRRLVRPFFLDPVASGPSPSKKYYDAASFIATQLTFSFATTPFLLLKLGDSVCAWSNVYFYGLGWTLACLVFFASPGKATLIAKLEQRQGKANVRLVRSISSESLTGMEPILGISKDLEQDMSEAMKEIRAEVEARQRKKRQKAH